MSGKSRAEMFEKAKKARNQQKEQENRGRFSVDYEPITYVGLEKDQQHVIRLLGNPILTREKGTDPKVVLYSMITGDNGKMFRCIFPDKQENKSHILWKIYNFVLDGKWNKETNTKDYYYVDEYPKIFNRVFKNGKSKDSKTYPMETGWRPTTYVCMNVIDRHDMKWHEENNHSKALSKKVVLTDDGEISGWSHIGVPMTLYNTIWDEIVEYNGDFQDYDIVVKKITYDPWYKAYHAIGDNKKIDESITKFIVDSPLTEQEENWERYDFDKIYPVISYRKIMRNLKEFIQEVDATFKKNFYEELVELAEKEKQEYEKVKEEEDKFQVLVEESKSTRSRKQSTDNSTNEFSINDIDKTSFKGLDKMTDEEKARIINVKDDKLIFEDGEFELLPCEECKYEFPNDVFVCPKCGKEYSK